jgi:hypothetical protein
VLIPFYWIRVLGGTLYLAGTVLMAANLVLTWKNRPARYDEPVYEAPPLSKGFREPPIPGSDLPPTYVLELGRKLDVFAQLRWHRKYEGLPIIFTILVAVGVVVASLGEIVPLFARKSDIARIAAVEPYTPLELVGRDIYISEGCANCHSQMIRPLRAETERYGEYSKPGEFVFDHPFLWGSRRIGPDLAREGGKTLDDCIAEVREAVDFCRYYAVEAETKFKGLQALPGPAGETNGLEMMGRGVFVCISPWNFPLAIFTGQIAGALAAGNTVLAKPAEQTPVIAFEAVKL